MTRMKTGRLVALIGLAAGLWAAASAVAQTSTPTTPTTTTGQVDINQILQTLGGLGGLGGTFQPTGTVSGNPATPTTTTTTGTTGGTGGTRTPSIVGNQFTTTSGGALQERRPGLFIQQAHAMQAGQIELSGTIPVEQPDFLQGTMNSVALSLINSMKGILTSVNALFGLSSVIPTTTTSTTTTTPTITNPTTTGAGTTTTIE